VLNEFAAVARRKLGKAWDEIGEAIEDALALVDPPLPCVFGASHKSSATSKDGSIIRSSNRYTGALPCAGRSHDITYDRLEKRIPIVNFNLYLDDQTAKELDRTAKKLGETRSGLIRKALREWLDKKTLGSPGWPRLILEWQGAPDMKPFESYRGDLLAPREHDFS